MMLNKKRNIDTYSNEEIKQKYKELEYKYEKVINENAALKLELSVYKNITYTKFFNDIQNKVINENIKRDEESFKENVILDLKNKIREKDLEISKLKGKHIIAETPKFNKVVDDKIIDDTFISMVLYKSFKIIQFHAIKNSIEKVGIKKDKTITALLNLTIDKVAEKQITQDEIDSFSKYFPMISNFIENKVEKDYDSLKSSNLLGDNMKKICEMMNYVLEEKHIGENDIKNIESFSNKIIK